MDDHTQHVQPDQTPGIADNLSVTQENAIDLLVQGHNDRQVAEAIGVRRETVCDWRNHNPTFSAELSRRRKDVRGMHSDHLGHLAATAIDVLATDLATPNNYLTESGRRIKQAAAVQILKASGFYREDPARNAQPAAEPEPPKTQPQPQTPEHDPLDWFHDFPPGG
jgi:transposase